MVLDRWGVLGTEHPLNFFNGGRALSSVLSRNIALRDKFQAAHGERFRRVRDYYLAHHDKVTLADVSPWVPELLSESTNIDEEDSDT